MWSRITCWLADVEDHIVGGVLKEPSRYSTPEAKILTFPVMVQERSDWLVPQLSRLRGTGEIELGGLENWVPIVECQRCFKEGILQAQGNQSSIQSKG